MYKLINIPTNGSNHIGLVDTPPSPEDVQKAVGGSFVMVAGFTTYKGDPCIAFSDADGLIKGKPINNRATQHWWNAMGGGLHKDVLFGDVLVIVATKFLLAAL